MRRLARIVAAVIVAGPLGCSGNPVVVPVSGIVSIDGQASDGVLVTFSPETLSRNNIATRLAIGVTDAQGRYTLKRGGVEGIEAGKYKVTFSRPMSGGRAVLIDAKTKPRGDVVESIPEPYMKPETTPVSVVVPKDGGDIPLEIKTK